MSFERWFLAFRLRLRSLLHRRYMEGDLDEELLFHIEQLTNSNIAKGMSPKEARYQALKAMEGYEQKKEECRDSRGVNWLEDIVRDIRYGLRMLRNSPVFTAVAILSLALGIGANSAIFSLIDTLLLRPLPVSHPQQLRNIYLRLPERVQTFLSYPVFRALETHNQAFTSLATWSNHRFQMASGDEVVYVDGALASGRYFSTLGVSPIQGRIFATADDDPSGGTDGPVAVISDRFWNRHYQRSPAAIGSGIVLDRIRFTVIGVMPLDFFGAEVGTHPDVWIPISFADKIGLPGCLASPSCWWLIVVGRMEPGVRAEQANAELATIGGSVLEETTPPGWNAAWKKRYRSYTFSSDSGEQGWSFLRLQFSNPLRILMSLVALVLLIACANLANLLMARASARHREIAVRLSMGAGRFRIIRQLLTESVLLSLAGGLAGTLFAFWLTRILTAFVSATQRHGPGQFTRLELHLDWRIVLFTLGVAFVSGIVFGLTPALRSTRAGIAASLKESAQSLRGREGRFQPGRLILSIQTAISVLLVAAAGLFAGSLFRLLTLSYGFNPDNISLIGVDTDRRPDKGPALAVLYARILERANALPGVKAASLLQFVPLSGGGWDENLHVPGKADLPESESDTFINSIGPRFFDVMETHLLSGRQFSEGDSATAAKVGIFSQLAAQRFFPGESPIGRNILLEGKPIRIVGVAENIKYLSLRDKEQPELYVPYAQSFDNRPPSFTVIIKTFPGAPSPDSAFRAMLHELAPDVPIGMTYTMDQEIDSSVGRERLMASLSIFFGILALLLTAIGLYGILAYSVTRRTGEIGIRMALGARQRNVIWLVLRGAIGYVLGGIIIGTIAVLAGSRVVTSLLYGVQPNDPGNLITAIGVLLFVSALAAVFPSLRASRVDPAISLRQE